MKNCSSRNIQKKLSDAGYTVDRKWGDHVVYKRGDESITITAPYINKMVEKRLIKQIEGGQV